ncbi:unnamed protein product [Arctia plantaginis]|uniref:Uncharacterized protein n=1 Tax=Arctia plantaginis TaxID=874455 RepID=A0A8S1AY19_ARCPL|nr:unnamed protein product [Arctia plantaginis]
MEFSSKKKSIISFSIVTVNTSAFCDFQIRLAEGSAAGIASSRIDVAFAAAVTAAGTAACAAAGSASKHARFQTNACKNASP